jgi:geranyl-CoA carboxylase alpha subunit
VTEAVTGLDLVEWQLRVAQGEPLPLTQEQLRFEGHAIEVRLCAEDEHFTPAAGTVLKFLPPPVGEGRGGGPCAPAIRFDHAIFAGLDVPPYYDSMLGKLIAHAPTRAEATARLAGALDRLQLLGLPTNRRLLAAILRHPVFAQGDARILFLDEHGDTIRQQLADQERTVVREAALAALMPAGTAPALPCPFPRPLRVRHREAATELRVNEAEGGVSVRGDAARLADGRWHVQCGAVDLFLHDASFEAAGSGGARAGANELRAPFNGKVIAVHAKAGARVARGEPLVVIESMKLEHVLAAARDAVVQGVEVEAGQQVATSQLLVRYEAA